MDILDIVNSHLKERELFIRNKLQEIVTKLNDGETLEKLATIYKVQSNIIKDHLNKEEYFFDINSKKWIKENQGERILQNISDEHIATIPYKLFSGSNLVFEAEQLSLSTDELKELLHKYNFKRRWRYLGNGNKSSINSDVLNIVNLLNTKKYSLQDISEKLNIQVEVLKETLKTANFKKIWTLESKIGLFLTETTIQGITIVRDLDTGILEYFIYNKEKYYTSNQVSTILGINTNYFFNLFHKKFMLNNHFIHLNQTEEKKIIQAIPSFQSISLKKLYSEQGLDLLAELSNRKSNLSNFRMIDMPKDKKIQTDLKHININDIKEQFDSKNTKEENSKTQLAKIDNKANKKFSSFFEGWFEDEESVILGKIINRLNKGETLYEISKEFVNNRKHFAPFATKLQFRLEDDGYVYNKSTKQWILNNKAHIKDKAHTKDTYITQNKSVKVDIPPKKELNINEVVNYLNSESSFRKAEVKFGIKNQDLRLLLKSNGYKYDGFFKLWTKKDRNILLKEILDDLEKGVKSYSDLKKRGVDITELAKEIQKYQKNVNLLVDVNLDNENDFIKEEFSESKDNLRYNEAYSFNSEEIKILRQMMSEWEENKSNNEINKNQILEVTFRLNHQILKQIDDYSEVNRISKSVVLEKALHKLFENEKLS
ncbi:hypothetical protein WKH31_11350 [Metabacillus indicus]|uniref:hypothetical protein n=1 Tax=Metabacillus indicus TaxID=246786 RepID=UPI003181DC39